jgi:hypothetical protein
MNVNGFSGGMEGGSDVLPTFPAFCAQPEASVKLKSRIGTKYLRDIER